MKTWYSCDGIIRCWMLSRFVQGLIFVCIDTEARGAARDEGLKAMTARAKHPKVYMPA